RLGEGPVGRQGHRPPVRLDHRQPRIAARGHQREEAEHERGRDQRHDEDQKELGHTRIVARWHRGDEPGTKIPTRGDQLATLRLGDRTFGTGDLAVMAIVNRTPDSFFDRGATYAEQAALAAAAKAVAEGADIIDIGGVKAGPGDEVDVAEEIRRTVSTVA